MRNCNEKDEPEHWRDRIASIPPTARNVRAAIEAWEFCQEYHYRRAVQVEMDVCFDDVETDEEWLKVFLWLMPHLKRQVEEKIDEDQRRYFARERRNYRSGRAS